MEEYKNLPLSDRNDKEFTKEELRKAQQPLKIVMYLGDDLKQDKDFILEIIKKHFNYYPTGNGLDLFYNTLPDNLKNDFDIARIVFFYNTNFREQLGPNLKNNKDFFIYLVKGNGLVLNFLSSSFKKDKDIVLEAVKNNPNAFEFASNTLKKDRSFIDKLYSINHKILDFVPLDIKSEYLEKEEAFSFEEEEVFYPVTKETVKDKYIKIKYDSMTLIILTDVKLSQLLLIRNNLKKAIEYIKRSPIVPFRSITENKNLYFVNRQIRKKFSLAPLKQVTLAQYFSKLDKLFFIVDNVGDIKGIDTIIENITHEFGHQFHSKHIKNGYENQEIIDLYNMATSKTECALTLLPKIGDSLSDLNVEDDFNGRKFWWTVKMSSNEGYILKKIIKNDYIYENEGGKEITLPKKDLLKITRCPSEYGSENEREFFAEMCTLITLNKVKPNQRLIADKFIDIVARNLK